MAGILWFPKFPADFMADTTDMDMLEVGIYNTLLDNYYLSGGNLPSDYYRLYTICLARHVQ